MPPARLKPVEVILLRQTPNFRSPEERNDMTTYRFSGSLCGYLCEDCSEPLSNVKVRLYRAVRQVAERAAADPKNTFELISAHDVAAKQGTLLAEAVTDAGGNFTFELGPA